MIKRKGAIISGIVLIGALLLGATMVEKIPTGYVGVQYSTSGGVSDEILTEGWHIVAPNKKVNEYSVAKESLIWSADERAGSKDDESFNVSCNDGTLNVDFEMQYSFLPDKVTQVFKDYRGTAGTDVVSVNLRSRIKTLINEITTQYSVLDVHQAKKKEVNDAITEYIKVELGKQGVEVHNATLSRTQPSAEVQEAITKRTTVAQELEAEKQKQEKALLEAETLKIQAQGKADAKLIEAQTEAEANRLLQESISDNLLKKMEMEARIKHGWITIQGADTIVTKDGGNN